jgi:hypothetical protein
MYDKSPDYSQYSIEELEEVLDNIDKGRFPERYKDAKAILERKQAEQPDNSETEQQQLAPRKWSEQPLLSRIVYIAFFVLCFSAFSSMFTEMMVAKRWSENTVEVTWVVVVILGLAWPICIVRDNELTQRLSGTAKGILAIFIMPFLFMLFAWVMVRQTLPLGLHYLSPKHEIRQSVRYQKMNGRKHCSQRLKILETAQWEEGDLCITQSQRDSLPEKGEIIVLGKRSHFGMIIDRFILP